MKNFKIEHMNKEELHLAIDWIAEEGWNPGLYDANCFYKADPQGFFAGKLNGKIIAIGSAVVYDQFFAFCGCYIVDKAYRGQGYGLALTNARLAYIGKRNAGIDGVSGMLEKYERLGYKLAHRNARYHVANFKPDVKENPAIIPIACVNFDALASYDNRHFPAPRNAFLRCWIRQPKTIGFAYVHANKLAGYGILRACHRGYKIGPLFADNEKIAEELFLQLASQAEGETIYLDIPEINPKALALVKRYRLEKVFETARMYLKKVPLLPMEEIYGITTYELG